MKLSKLIRVDRQHSALLLLRWYRATNRKYRKLGLRPYITAWGAREEVIATYGWGTP